MKSEVDSSGRIVVRFTRDEAEKINRILIEATQYTSNMFLKAGAQISHELAARLGEGARLLHQSASSKSRARGMSPALAAPYGKTWRTKDGREIPLKTMSVYHLKNALKMIERAAPHEANRLALQALSYASTAPDGASYAAEGEADALLDGEYSVGDLYPIYNDLVKELASRKTKKR